MAFSWVRNDRVIVPTDELIAADVDVAADVRSTTGVDRGGIGCRR